MNEEHPHDRDTTGMNEHPELQHLFDSAGHLTSSALNESIDGSLSSRDETLLTDHLTGCAECTVRREELAQTISLVRSVPDVEPGRSFEIAPHPAQASVRPAKSRFQGVITPAFPILRVAIAAVFLLLVGVTATDLITQQDDQPEQAAIIADTPASRTESVATNEAAGATEPAPAAPDPNMQATDSEESLPAPESDSALPTQEPSEAFGQEAADDDAEARDAGQAADTGSGAADEATPPTPEPSPTATEPESRIDAAEESDGLSNWRIAQIALLLLLFWLVVTWIGLERMRKR